MLKTFEKIMLVLFILTMTWIFVTAAHADSDCMKFGGPGCPPSTPRPVICEIGNGIIYCHYMGD